MSVLDEPWDPAEHAWAQRHRGRLATPLPAVGDAVCYRHRHFGDVTRARVVLVQDLDDREDGYLWDVAVGPSGLPLIDGAGKRVQVRRADPWVTLRLATDWGHLECREARVRGSAGWLPLDWERRLYPAIVEGRFVLRRQTEVSL